jgi:hypothetical protein
MFKVGKVSYLNTVPMFYCFEDPMIELVEGEPSYLVSLLRDGKFMRALFPRWSISLTAPNTELCQGSA